MIEDLLAVCYHVMNRIFMSGWRQWKEGNAILKKILLGYVTPAIVLSGGRDGYSHQSFGNPAHTPTLLTERRGILQFGE